MAVCSRDGDPARLAVLLADVRAQLGRDDTLLVVDSASTGPTVADAARAAGAALERLEVPGVSRARNHALATATTSWVAFLDDDCRPAPGWLAGLRRGLADGVGAVFGRVDVTDEPGVPLSVLLVDDPYEVTLADLDRAGHGANVAVRSDAVVAVGGFDPLLGAGALFPGAEDKDLAARLLVAGHRVRVVPDAPVAHHPRATRGEALAALRAYGRGAGACHHKLRRLGVAVQAPLPAAGRRAAAALRAGHRFGVVMEAAFAAGVVDGAWRARPLDVADGRLVRGHG